MMKMNKVIIFNGPPSSGKDLFASILYKYMVTNEAHHNFANRLTFKKTLIDLTQKYYQISSYEWSERYNEAGLKEIGWDKLGGLSQREALIDMSENKIKPMLGNDFLGKALAFDVRKSGPAYYNTYYLVSDGGFKEELQPIIDKVGEDNVIVLRLHRDGYDFSGDSRGYIEDDWFPNIRIYDIESGEQNKTFKEIMNYLFG